jgi:hypothetical protein
MVFSLIAVIGWAIAEDASNAATQAVGRIAFQFVMLRFLKMIHGHTHHGFSLAPLLSLVASRRPVCRREDFWPIVAIEGAKMGQQKSGPVKELNTSLKVFKSLASRKHRAAAAKKVPTSEGRGGRLLGSVTGCSRSPAMTTLSAAASSGRPTSMSPALVAPN